MSAVDPSDLAHQASDAVLDILHGIQARHSGPLAVSTALGSMAAAVSFIRAACGDEAAVEACEMVSAIARARLDVVLPVGRAQA